ncbi:vWA domain-containing protein [Candidatus Nanohalovita haloferacivicina]|uniref:vWA domain-containing protein n=1 Tax=Candidatus Nanohalovita haloferacivicina TaxID=2978046 RepID=UPI00325FA232|nr:vWFA domain containing protein [Candidatus Nanohalobia archaeon BNXNv]
MITFEHSLGLILVLISFTGLYAAYRAEEIYGEILGLTRFLLLFLLALAVAGPQIQMAQERMRTPEVNILEDNSRSTQFMQDDKVSFQEIQTNRNIIASGNNSEMKNSILNSIQQDGAYLIVSDLQTDEDMNEVIRKANRNNASISFLKPEMTSEHAITIEGPEQTVPGANNQYTVKLSSTKGGSVPVEVRVDGNQIHSGRITSTYNFTRKFGSKGHHKIQASIDVNDQESSNNAYYKTVEVTKKPEILVIGQSSSLGTDLSEYFRLEYTSSVPEDMSDYDAVLLKEDVPEENLIEYVSQGGGLVYTGDHQNSYDVLPVKEADDSEESSKAARVIMAVDTSASFYSERSRTKEKARYAAKYFVSALYRQSVGSKVAVINYGGTVQGSSYVPRIMRNPGEPAFLSMVNSEDKNRVFSRVDSLDGIGGAIQSYGLRASKELAEKEQSKSTIVMITDGRFEDVEKFNTQRTQDDIKIESEQDKQNFRDIAMSLDDSKTSLCFLTIGGGADTAFLNGFVDRTNIVSFEDMRNQGRFCDLLGGGGNSGAGRVYAVNNQHFISRGGINPDLAVAGTYNARLRPSGNLILATGENKPVLATWRYGLGRVAAFTTRDSNLGDMMRGDPSSVVRTFSWSVGEIDREGRWIKVSSTRVGGQKPEVEASYSIEGLTRDADGTYSKTLDPEGLGFHEFNGVPYSYNYNSEIENIGYDSRIERIASETGGKVYEPSQKGQIVEDLQTFSDERVVRRTSLTPYLLIAALIVFLGEVGFRKMKGRK